jgi:putative flippase GtrA
MVGVPLLVAVGLNAAVFGVEGAIAKAIVTVAVIILNYIFSKLFIFKDKKQ